MTSQRADPLMRGSSVEGRADHRFLSGPMHVRLQQLLSVQGSVQGRIPRASQRLLAFLALHDWAVNRAAIAGTLWPDASERHAYSNLRSALARLERTARKALWASKLELGLAEDVTVDLRQSQALARRLLDPAVTLGQCDQGASTVGALSADLPPGWYDDWVLVQAENWWQLRLHALEALAQRLTAAGRWGR